MYFILTVPSLAASIILFIAPETLLSSGVISGGLVFVTPYVLALLFSVLLIMLLMRKAANNLHEP